MKIAGPPSATSFRVGANLVAKYPKSAGRFFELMLPVLWQAALMYDIDPVVMVAQSGKETAWGTFLKPDGTPGNARPGFCNTAGIKIARPDDFPGCSDGDKPLAHAQFASFEAGAEAHAQHLLAYLQRPLPQAAILLDPRWQWVYGRKAAITDVEQLGGAWAPAADYGQSVAAIAQALA